MHCTVTMSTAEICCQVVGLHMWQQLQSMLLSL